MPLPSEQYAFLSHTIYNPVALGQRLKSDTSEYNVIYVSPSSATNYRGAVVIEKATGQMVIVNKGTDPFVVHDIMADLGMGMMGKPTQWPEAAATMQWALEYAARKNIPVRDVSITGHSLGGALAQLQAAMPQAAGVHAETFNTYGALSMTRGPYMNLDPASAQDRVVNHRMYHDPVSKPAESIGRMVDYMDEADYRRHRDGGMAMLGDVTAGLRAHGISNFWDGTQNRPGAVFNHNYIQDLHHRALDNLPKGMPLDRSLSIPRFGEQDGPRVPSLAPTANTKEMFDYLCKAMDGDDDHFMEALRQIGQTDSAKAFHAEIARQVDVEDRMAEVEAQLRQFQEQQQIAQVQQMSGPVMRR